MSQRFTKACLPTNSISFRNKGTVAYHFKHRYSIGIVASIGSSSTSDRFDLGKRSLIHFPGSANKGYMHNWNKGSNNILIPTKTTNSANVLLSQLNPSNSHVASMKLAVLLKHEHGVSLGHVWLYSQHRWWLHSQIAPHFDISHTAPIVVKANPAAIMPHHAYLALDASASASVIVYCDEKMQLCTVGPKLALFIHLFDVQIPNGFSTATKDACTKRWDKIGMYGCKMHTKRTFKCLFHRCKRCSKLTLPPPVVQIKYLAQ